MKKMSASEDLAAQALTRLKAKADPLKAAGARKYFKEEDSVEFYGLSSSDVREIAKDLCRSIKTEWDADAAIRFCDILFHEAEHEAKAVGALVLASFKKDLPKSLFDKIKSWLARDLLNNWAAVDVFCPEVVGALLLKYPDLTGKIKSWTRHPNRWVKRASIVSFIKLAKKEKYRDVIYDLSQSMFVVEDDLIFKANGWLLREVGKQDQERLERFLLKHGPVIPRTTLRYAIERFGEKKRKELLARTKSS